MSKILVGEEKEYFDGLRYVDNVFSDLLESYRDKLNSYVGCSWELKQWKMVYWIYYESVYTLLYEYNNIKHSEDPISIVHTVGIETQRGRNLIADREWIREFICDFLKKPYDSVDDVTIENLDPKVRNRPKHELLNDAIHRIRKNPCWIRLFCNKIRYGDYRYTFYQTKANCEVMLMDSRMPVENDYYVISRSKGKVAMFNPRHIANTKQIFSEKDEELRRRVFVCDDISNEFKCLLNEFLKRVMDVEDLECLKPIYRYVLEISQQTYRKVYHSAGLYYAVEKVFCAEQSYRGALICDIQHAAAYNFWRGQSFFEHEIFDSFLTWGWTDALYKKTRAVAVYRYPQSFNKLPKKNKIKLMTGAIDFNAEVCGGNNSSDYLVNRINFIESLSDENRKKLVIRVRDYKTQKVLNKYLGEKYPYIEYEYMWDKTIVESMSESELVVIDYASSIIIEALFIKKPVVMFDGLDIISENPEWNVLKDKLYQIGTYRKNGVELGEVINSKSEFDEWLSTPEVVDVYKELGIKMAGLDKSIKQAWFEEFVGD